MFLKTTTLNLMKKSASKYQEQLLELNLQHLTSAFSWVKWKPLFLKHNNCSHSSGLDILMAYFLYRHMVKILTSFIQTWNFHTKHLRIVLDLNVSLKDGAIFTDLHIKPTVGHQFLHYKSSLHSHHRSISMHIYF